MEEESLDCEGIVDVGLIVRLGTLTIFSIDKELQKNAKDFTIVNPIPEDSMKKYHSFISSLLKK